MHFKGTYENVETASKLNTLQLFEKSHAMYACNQELDRKELVY